MSALYQDQSPEEEEKEDSTSSPASPFHPSPNNEPSMPAATRIKLLPPVAVGGEKEEELVLNALEEGVGNGEGGEGYNHLVNHNGGGDFVVDGGNEGEIFIEQQPLDDVDEEESRRLQNVASQEQMIHLLPTTNPSYQEGGLTKEASISCRFKRQRHKHTGDKWKTIGPGGSRLSTHDLTLQVTRRPSNEANLSSRQWNSRDRLSNSNGSGGGGGGNRHNKPHVHQNGGSSSSSAAAANGNGGKASTRRVNEYRGEEDRLTGAFWHDMNAHCRAIVGRMVKAIDDTILGVTAPAMGLILALCHQLPRATNKVSFEKDLRMPIIHHGEEHSLSFMFLHPVNMRKKYPTILVRNPYGRLTFFYFFYVFAQRGYNVVVQDVRGRGESTGVFDCLLDYDDGQATLDWIISQPWYSAEHGIGLLGMSYNGFVLYSTFKRGPIHPAVKAIVPINTTSRLSTINYRDGPLHLELIIRWSGYLWTLTRDTTSLLALLWSLNHGLKFLGYFGIFDHPALTRGLRHLPVQEITKKVTGVQLNRFSMFMSPPDCDFVKERCASAALRPNLPPAQIHASWYDIFLIDSLFDYQTLVEKGHKHARILISSDFHVKRYFHYGALVKSALVHFRRFLRHDPLPYKDDDRLRIQIIHCSPDLEWVGFSSWPPACQPTTAFLSADGRLQLSDETDVDATASAINQVQQGARPYTYFPSDPTPSIGGNGIGFLDAGARPQKLVEMRDGRDILVYTSEILQEDMYVIGIPEVSLTVRCLTPRAQQADFVVRLCNVFPNGRSLNICDGVKRLRFSDLERDSRGAFKVDFQIYPTAVRFAKGHRIRIHVASAGFIRWERNIHTMGYPSLLPARFEVMHGGGGSRIKLPVLPVSSLRKCEKLA